MENRRFSGILIFNGVLALTMLILFSNRILGINGNQGILGNILFIVAIVVCFIVFIVGNLVLMCFRSTRPPVSLKKAPVNFHDGTDYVRIISSQYGKRGLKKYVDMQIEQIERFEFKEKTIRDLIGERFQSTELTYTKFNGAVDDAETVFYTNLKSIINKMAIFDGDEYARLKRKTYTINSVAESTKEQILMFESYLDYIRSAIESNEGVILKLEKLIMEVSLLTTLSDEEIKNRAELKELDEFIGQIKLYKKV